MTLSPLGFTLPKKPGNSVEPAAGIVSVQSHFTLGVRTFPHLKHPRALTTLRTIQVWKLGGMLLAFLACRKGNQAREPKLFANVDQKRKEGVL